MLSVRKIILTVLITPLLFINFSNRAYSKETTPQDWSKQIEQYLPKNETKEIDPIKVLLNYDYTSTISNSACTFKLDYHYKYFCKTKKKDKPIYADNFLKTLNRRPQKPTITKNPNYEKYFQKETLPVKNILSLITSGNVKREERRKNLPPLINIFSKLEKEDKRVLFVKNLLASISVSKKEREIPKIEFKKDQVSEEIDHENSVTFTQAILPVRFVYLDERGNIVKIWSNVKSTDTSYVLKFFRDEIELEKNERLLFSYYKTMEETTPYQQGIIYDTSMSKDILDTIKSWNVKGNKNNQEEILSFI